MRSLPRGSLVLAAVAFLAAAVPAQGPAAKTVKTPGPASPREDIAAPSKDQARVAPDKLPLPPGAVLVPYEMIKGSLRLLPMVLVRPEKFRAMEERIKELERRLHPGKGATYRCKLTGRVEGDFVTLQADLRVLTEQPRSEVVLGFQGAVLSGDPELDGQLPVISYGADDGFLVQVDKPGSHHLTLPLKLPVTVPRQEVPAGGVQRACELGLPGAAVTSLTLELSRAVKEVRWNGVAQKAVPGRPGTWEIAPGNARTLKLTWREPAPTPGGGPALAARWQTTVTLQEEQALIEARVTAADRRGAGEWRVWAPPGATLKVLAPEGVAYDVAPAGGDGTLVVRGPPAERLEVLVTARRPRPFTRLPVGPFLLVGADRQEGAIEVRAAAEALRGFRLIYHRQGNVRQQDVPKDKATADVQARFQYWDPPEAGRPGGSRRAPLELETKAVATLVEASVEHVLRLGPADEGWQVVVETRIQATPLHNGADFLEVLLPRPRPPALQALAVPGAAPAGPLAPWLIDTVLPLGLDRLWPVVAPASCTCEQPAGAELQPRAGPRKARIQLPQPQLKRFTVLLKETYVLPGDVRAARLELPRPLAALDRGGAVKVEVDDSQELVLPGEGAEPSVADRHGYATTSASAPAFVDLAWRPFRPDVPAVIVADVTARRRDAHVREELRLPDRRPAGARAGDVRPVRLRVSGRLSGLKVTHGGRLARYDSASGLAHAEATGGALVLEYDFALPPRPGAAAGKAERGRSAGRPFPVPLLWPTDATRAETKVRVWCEPGVVPVLPDVPLPDERWKDRGSEVVPGRGSLPALVLEAEGKELPLTLRLVDSALPPLVDVLAERVLIQVAVDDKGDKRYRARFLLSKLDAEHLDIELPVPVARLPDLPQILLAGLKVPPQILPSGKTVRVLVRRGLYTVPVVLDVSYEVPADHPEADGMFRTGLYPPVLLGDVFVGRVRWQVALPPAWVALPPGGHAGAEQRWAVRDWLLAPEPALTGPELEQWLTGADGGEAAGPTSLVFWGAGLEPVAVAHFPRLVWLFVCSGALLLLAVVLLAAPVSRAVFGVAAGLLGLGAVAAGLTWPAAFPAVAYGCEPGAAVLLLVLAVQWILQRRYRRQVVFMPGFTRGRPGSSLSRGSSVQRPRELSTVDAPQAAAGAAGSSKGSAKEVST
jgi:hypothetical protein